MRDVRRPINPSSTRFLDQLKMHIRSRNLSYNTEKVYVHWVLRFIRYHFKRHPIEMAEKEVEAFLNYLANQRRTSKSTQRVALNSIIYLYREFLKIDLSDLSFSIASKPRKLPTVFSDKEARLVIQMLSGKYALAASLIYGSGLRVSEVSLLRIKDIDFEMNHIMVRSGKGNKDRTTLLPDLCKPSLQRQISIVKAIHEDDLANGHGKVYLEKMNSVKTLVDRVELKSQFLFPANAITIDKLNNVSGRHHLDETIFRKAINKAIRESGILKDASTHTFRHSFATQSIINGINIRELQELMGHSSVSTTQIYIHVVENTKSTIVSPLDY